MEVLVPADQVVLVAPVGVAGAIGVVLEDEDLAPNSLFLQTLLGSLDQALEDSLACLVVRDHIFDHIALGSGELGMGSNVEVEPGSVLQEHVG